jgi:Na+:H+ antiporter, NhaA family
MKTPLSKLSRKGHVYNAPWEKAFDQILTPIEVFIHRQTTSGILLFGCAIVAMFIANSGYAPGYEKLLKTYFTVSFGEWELSLSLHHWINDFVMAWFFLLVGLELKREIQVGELSDIRKAMLPIMAAIGGMVIPASFYLMLNPSGHMADGWGIPMATDIAFAIGAIALLGARVPKSLVMFLVALAIVDDLGAIAVIALFYTQELDISALIYAGITTVLLMTLNLGGIRRSLPYMLIGAFLWLFLLKSGVHATLAGVILAFTIPAKPKYDPEAFSSQIKRLTRMFDGAYRPGEDIVRNDRLRSYVQSLESGVRLVQAPLQVIEHALHLPVTYLVIPIFALANAGLPFEVLQGDAMTHPITLGVIFGLVGGKLIGIAGATWIGWKLGLGKLPEGCNFQHIIGVSLLGGIGFTMSIFIAELGFATNAEDLLMAKAGIVVGSLIAGISGFLCLYYAKPEPNATPQANEVELT